MRFIAQISAFTAVVFLLSGCAEQWVKPGATEMEFDATHAQCTSRAAQRIPPAYRLVQVGGGYVTPVDTECHGDEYHSHCRSYGGNYVPPSMATIDDNEDARRQDVRACLYENGWQPLQDN